ncbi:MAG: dihydroorotate dehydrogenase electron transfer subunit [Chloroflexi bacterium]|nr:dihydroorotate dehydrogenase electron transfer subunit [Chloroflexota bacterium]
MNLQSAVFYFMNLAPRLVTATITFNREMNPGHYLLCFESPEIASTARPGQFVMVRCGRGQEMVTRRPLSIHLAQGADVWLYFAAVGDGTRWLASLKPGEALDIVGPLGNSFDIRPGTGRLLLVAGGAGISPLVFLATEALKQGCQVRLFQGAATKDQLYTPALPLSQTGDIQPCLPLSQKGNAQPTLPLSHKGDKGGFPPLTPEYFTEDGSQGKKGPVTDCLTAHAPWAEQICACGPAGMYASMEQHKQLWRRNSCQVSLETRMGCGIGACFACTIKTKNGLKRVCRDGPVFELDDLILSEIKV